MKEMNEFYFQIVLQFLDVIYNFIFSHNFLLLYIYVCIYIYMYVCMYVCIYVYIYIWMFFWGIWILYIKKDVPPKKSYSTLLKMHLHCFHLKSTVCFQNQLKFDFNLLIPIPSFIISILSLQSPSFIFASER